MSTTFDNPWRFIATAPNGQEYGEIINAHDRRVSVPSNGMPSASCRVNLTHPLADTLLMEDVLIKVYRGTTMVFHGPVVSVEETADSNGRSLAITAAGAWWRASRRFIPESLTDNGLTIDGGWSFSLGELGNPLIDATNLESFCGVST